MSRISPAEQHSCASSAPEVPVTVPEASVAVPEAPVASQPQQSSACLRPGEREALAAALLAARGGRRGATPLVGAAVLAADGTQVTGFHAGAGHRHAEPLAIAAAEQRGIDLRTACLIVTLEPCAHTGRTPACTEAILAAGIPRVVYAVPDPHAAAAGGAAVLRAAGIDVVCAADAQPDAQAAAAEVAAACELNERWLRAQHAHRPFVTAKLATSLDGRIAAADGTSQWITGAQTRARVHALRARVDAVIVGTGTAIADDPRLTVRTPAAVPVRQPIPVVIGTRELPAGHHLTADPRTLHLRTRDLPAALRTLRARGIEHVLLEGGAGLLSAALEADLIDDLHLHLGDRLLGGAGLAATAGLQVATLAAGPRFVPEVTAASGPVTCGTDTLLHLRPAPATTSITPSATRLRSTPAAERSPMFTGIIESTGTVRSITPVPGTDTLRLSIAAGSLVADLPAGGSLAVDGVCLTSTPEAGTPEAGAPGLFTADVMGETLARTSLGALTPGQRVNLERCLPASGRFDGHIVQGHVDGVGRILSITDCGAWTRLRVSVPAELAGLLVEKGSIALNGTSLTLTAVSGPEAAEAWCEVGLIPATLAATTFGTARTGQPVNIEADVLAKYARSLTGAQAPASPWTVRPWEEALAGGPSPSGDLPAAGDLSASGDLSPAVLDSVETAIARLRRGEPVIVVDDAEREDEGDLIVAAELLEAEWMGFIVRHSSGVVCAPMTAEIAAALDLPPMTARNEDPKGTNYTVSCDALGLRTGISAAERTATLRTLAEPASTPASLTRPGHIFPLIAAAGGVRERPGHTEAGVELARLAGCRPVAAIAELVDERGEMLRGAGLLAFARRFGLALISIAELRTWLDARDAAPEAMAASVPEVVAGEPVALPSAAGDFTAQAFTVGSAEMMLIRPAADPTDTSGAAPLVRVHSECLTGDVFASVRCDCGEQLQAALARISAEGGAVLYVTGHEGRGIGLAAKLAAYRLQDTGLDTVAANERLGLPVDARDYTGAAAVLQAAGLDRIRLLTNNPAKAAALQAAGVTVTEVVGLEVPAGDHNRAYLATKRDRMHHSLTQPGL